MSNTSSAGNTSGTTKTSQRTYFLEATLCVSPRFGIFKTRSGVDEAIRAKMLAAVKESGIRYENIETSSTASTTGFRHTLSSASCNILCTTEEREALKIELEYQLTNIQHNYERAHTSKTTGVFMNAPRH